MVADTFSALLGLLEQGTGNNNNTWGALLNTGVMDKVDLAIAGVASYAVTGGTLDLSGTPPPAGPSGAIQSSLVFSGTLTSNQIVKVPNLTKWWMMKDNTGGAFTVSIQTPSGAPVALPRQGTIQNNWVQVFCDGANNIYVSPYNGITALMPNGSISAPSYTWANETNSGWYRAASGDFRFSDQGTDLIQFASPTLSPPGGAVNILASQLLLQGVQIVPAGVIAPYGGIAQPTGWLLCAGEGVSRATFAALFNALTITATANTHTNTTVDNISVDLRGLGVSGAIVEGSGIPAGTALTITGPTTGTLSNPSLSSLTGTTIRLLPYGQGDASSTFNIPDLRGRAVFGRDDMVGTPAPDRIVVNNGKLLGVFGGEEVHTLTNAEIPPHTHAVFLNDPGHNHTIPVSGFIGTFASNTGGQGALTSGTTTGTNTTGITVRDTTGGGGTANQTATAGGATPPGNGAHNTMPPFQICNYIIKT